MNEYSKSSHHIMKALPALYDEMPLFFILSTPKQNT